MDTYFSHLIILVQAYFDSLSQYDFMKVNKISVSFGDFLLASIILGFIFRYLFSKVVR